MVLSPGQFYCVSLCLQTRSIQLDVILDKSTKLSAENRKELIEFFDSTLGQILQQMMPAAAKPICYVKCPFCPNLHIKLKNVFEGRVQPCGMQAIPLDYYQDFFKNFKGMFSNFSNYAL